MYREDVLLKFMIWNFVMMMSVFLYVCSKQYCVKRKLLLEGLANELPSGTIRYLSKVVALEESDFSKVVHLADGTTIKTKVIK
jgi:exopolysaccharide biosynthesis protein